MLKIVFNNMESSELAKDIVQEKIRPIIDKFHLLENHKITLTLERENSPEQGLPDMFTVSTFVCGKVFKKLKLRCSSGNFYVATAELAEGLENLLANGTQVKH